MFSDGEENKTGKTFESYFFSFLKIKSRAANKHKREGENSFS